MAKRIRSIPMTFDYIKLGTDIRGAVMEMKISLTDLDNLAGVSAGTSSRLASHLEPNPKMNTWLTIVNALDLDPREYFKLG